MIVYEGDTCVTTASISDITSWAYGNQSVVIKTVIRRPIYPPENEALVEAKAKEILRSDKVHGTGVRWRAEAIRESIVRLEDEMRRLDRKSNENVKAESELVNLRIRAKVSDEAYERQMVMLLAERKWISDERGRIQQKLTDLKQQASPWLA